MSRRKLNWAFSAVLALLLVVGFSAASKAQTPDASPVAPPAGASPTPSDTVWFILAPEGKSNGEYFDVEIEAGESATLHGQFGNGSQIPVTAIIYAADVTSGINGGFVLADATAPISDPTTWLDLQTETYDFDAQEVFDSSFTVSVPEDTAPGQYITGIAIETVEAADIESDPRLKVKYRLAAPVLITVPGPVEASFEIGQIDAEIDELSASIVGEIENTGNIRVRPEGTLTVTNEAGVEVITAQIAMSSVYAGDTTQFQIFLPTPLEPGTYTVSTTLEDPDTEASASVSNVEMIAIAAEVAGPVSLTTLTVAPMPSAEQVVFAQISATIANTGTPMQGAELTLSVFRDGELVDSQVLGTSVTLQNGETVIEQPYIPGAGTWEPGVYTFQITLAATDPATGTEVAIFDAESDTEIVVP